MSFPPVWRFQNAIIIGKITKKRVQEGAIPKKVGNNPDARPGPMTGRATGICITIHL
jgi:hypothetical protein